MNLGDGVHSCDTCISVSNRVDEHTYQSSEECPPTFSKCKNPKSIHLRCMCTNAHSLGNKKEELELHAQSGNYDVIGIKERRHSLGFASILWASKTHLLDSTSSSEICLADIICTISSGQGYFYCQQWSHTFVLFLILLISTFFFPLLREIPVLHPTHPPPRQTLVKLFPLSFHHFVLLKYPLLNRAVYSIVWFYERYNIWSHSRCLFYHPLKAFSDASV